MVKKSKQGDYKGKGTDTTSNKVKDILTYPEKIEQLKKTISQLSRDDKRELRAKLNSSERTDLKNKLSKKDIKTILEILDKEESNTTLYKTNELRPEPWSQKATIFNVYETDEENFVPYVSPLATVGTINTGTSSSDTEETDETSILPESSEEEGEEENSGLLGLGTGIL